MIYLASRSPRRRDLLSQIGVKFEPLLFREGSRQDADTDEAQRAGEDADSYVRRVTQMKAEAAWQRIVMRRGLRRMPVLAADTTVALDTMILAKPVDPRQLIDTIAALRRERLGLKGQGAMAY